jgi:TolB-like protein/Flp pilus assembly protein TadD
VQWTLAYGAAAYTLLHVVEMLSGALEWPHVIVRVVTLLLLLGLPVATTLAWFHGHKAQRRVSGQELALLTVLLLAAGGVLWFLGRPTHERTPERVAAQAPAPGNPEAPAKQRPSDRSLAVLPLVDMTPTGGNAYFGDGLSEELSAQLARIPGLRVSARTSAFEFKGKNVDVRKIGETLGVRYVLEGSVRRDDNRLRVTVQLIDSDNGYHVWAETYDREWRDVIAVQDDIAQQVTRALKVTLTPEGERRLATAEEVNLRAYDHYLAGLSKMHQGGSLTVLEEAESLFRRSLDADPGFARAQAGLCEVTIMRYERSNDTGLVPAAETACRAALETDPTLKETELALGRLYLASGRLEQSEAVYRSLLARAPDDADVRIGLGRALARLNRTAEAEKSLREAIAIEPGYWQAYSSLGNFLFNVGRNEEAARAYARVTDLAPGNTTGFNNLGAARMAAGDLDGSAKALEQSTRIAPSRAAYLNLGTLYYARGRMAEAAAMYSRAADVAPEDFVVYGFLGDAHWFLPNGRDRARQEYRRAAALGEKALAVDATDGTAWALLGWYYARLGDDERSIRYGKRAAELSPEAPQVSYQAAVSAAARGDRQ